MKVIIAGGRDYKFTEEDVSWLDSLNLYGFEFKEIVSGGARGADFEGELYASMRGIPLKRFVADWNKHGRAAGPIRNKQMAEYADALIAFSGGKGTLNMISEAEKLGLKVYRREVAQ